MLHLFISLFLVQVLFAAEAWKFETLYDGEVHSRSVQGKTILYRSNDSTTHIFYGADKLYHLKYDGAWSTEIVDDNLSTVSAYSATLSSDGTLYVSYLMAGQLRYASKELNGEHWNIVQTQHQTIHRQTAICVDSNNTVHIFYAGDGGIHYTTSDAINQAQIFAPNSDRASVVYDAQTGIHIAYRSQEEGMKGVWYANNHTGSFIHRRIYNSSDEIFRVSIDASSESSKKAVAIIYYHDHDGFAKFFDTSIDNYNGAWSTSIAYDANADISIKVSNTTISAAFLVEDDQNLPYVLKLVQKDNTGTRISEMLRGYRYFEQVNLEYIGGFLRVKYYDILSNTLGWIYKNEALEWEKEIIRDFKVVGDFLKTDMKVYNNNPQVVFKTPHDGLQYFFRYTDGRWGKAPFATTTVFDPKLSIVDDGFTDTWIQYINTETLALERVKYGHYFNGLNSGWRWFGLEAENKIDDADIYTQSQKHDTVTQGLITHSCYVDETRALFYVSNNNENGWSQSQSLHNGIVAERCSIDVDESGHVHIAYTDIHDALYHISNESGAWIYEEIGLENKRKKSPHIKISDGIAHICFRNISSYNLEYIKSSNFSVQTPRSWPPSARVVLNEIYNSFDMLIDAKEKAHFAGIKLNKLYHIVDKGLDFEVNETDLGFYAEGIKLIKSDDALYILFLNTNKGDIIFGTLKTKKVPMSAIMYLLF